MKKVIIVFIAVFTILTFAGIGYALYTGGQAGAGYAVVPSILTIGLLALYRGKYKSKQSITLKQFFSSDDSYKKAVSQYTAADGLLAVSLYIFLILIYYVMGVLLAQKQIYLGVPINFLLIALCVLLVLIRRQKLDSIGITLNNIKKALLTGAVLGVIFTVLMNIIPNILAGGRLIPAGQAIYNTFYYFIVISLSEEIVFRGYIQTRIYALIKRDVPAVILTGLLFYAMHLPFLIPINGLNINLINMAIIVSLHFVMNFLYRKYNSLAAPTIFHGILDWGGNLLR